jgi:hypothetical protein
MASAFGCAPPLVVFGSQSSERSSEALNKRSGCESIKDAVCMQTPKLDGGMCGDCCQNGNEVDCSDLTSAVMNSNEE